MDGPTMLPGSTVTDSPTSSRVVLAADLGGTQFRVAIVEESGRLLDRHAIPTMGHLGPSAVLDRMADACREMLARVPKRATVLGLGIAAPSPIDPKRGVVYQAPNIPGWVNIALRDEMADRLRIPVLVGNDANFAALGEWRFGAGRGHGDLIFLTFSTGVGSGFVTGGRLLVGHYGLAGEAGHTVIQVDGPLCGCGKRGCLEAFASGTAIRREALQRRVDFPQSTLHRYADLSAADVEAEAQRGDPLALELMRDAGRYAGIGIATLVHIFDPDVVVVGGGVSHSGPHWWETLQQSVREQVLEAYRPGLRIVPAMLGDDVGIFGSAAAMLDPTAAGA
jgi:glucokinase